MNKCEYTGPILASYFNDAHKLNKKTIQNSGAAHRYLTKNKVIFTVHQCDSGQALAKLCTNYLISKGKGKFFKLYKTVYVLLPVKFFKVLRL